MLKKIRSVQDFIANIEETGLTRPRKILISILGFLYLWRTEIVNDRCPQRASSLTYTTLLAIFPLIAVIALFIPPFFGGVEELEEKVIENLEGLLMPSVSENIRSSITSYFETFMVNSRPVGVFGVAGLILSAVALFSTIEKAFNAIWQARSHSSWVNTFSRFTTLLVCIPIFIGGSIMLTVELTKHIEFVGRFVSLVIPYLLTWTALTLAFYILPNTKVKLHYAMIGALAAGLFWEIAKVSFNWYIMGPQTNLFLKSIGAIPIFLIWIYISWLIVLGGCELAFVMQYYPRLRSETFRKIAYTTLDSKLVFLVFMVIADNFQKGQGSISFAGLLNAVPLKVDELEKVVNLLYKAELIKETKEGEFILARPLETIRPHDILALGCDINALFRRKGDIDIRIGKPVIQLQESILKWSSNQSIHDFLKPPVHLPEEEAKS